MKKRSLEKLFARYVAKGDVRALGEVFDRAAPELLVIAGHIARDVAAAEDLVQTTFVVAIERGATFDARRPLMPWLVGILTRHSRYQRRREARVAPPDRVGAPRPADPVLASEAREFGSALSSALSELPNTYRDVLFAHLAGGMKPREIARDLGRAPGTVRVQIHRGLDLLRKALPAGFALGTTAAVLPTRGLAAMRAEVLCAGGKAIAAGSAGAVASSAATVAGGTLVKTSAYAGILIALSLGTGWLAWGAREPLAFAPEGVALVAPVSPIDAPSRNTVTRVDAPRSNDRAPAESALHSERPSARGTQRYFVRGRLSARGSASLEGASVVVETTTAPGVAASSTSDRDGGFEVDVSALAPHALLEKSELLVTVDHPDFLVERKALLTRWKRDSRLDALVLEAKVKLGEPAAFVVGTLDALEEPVAVALFPLGRGREPGERPEDTAVVQAGAANAAFRLRAARTGPHLIVLVAAGRAPHGEPVDVERTPREIDVGHVTLESGEALSGRVRLPAERSADGSRIAAVYREETLAPLAWQGLGWTRDGVVRARAECRAGADGRFHLDGLAPGVHRLDVLPPNGLPSGETRERSEYAASTPGITLFANVGLLRVSVTGAGSPIHGAVLRAAGSEDRSTSITDAAGIAEHYVPSLAPSTLFVAKAGFRTAQVEAPPLRPGGSHDLRVELQPLAAGTTDLAIVAYGAAELPTELLVQRVGKGGREGLWVAEGEGDSFRVSGLPPGPTELVLGPLDPSSFLLEAIARVDLREGETTRCSCELREGGFLDVAVDLPGAREAVMVIESAGGGLPRRVALADDRAARLLLPPGDHDVRISAEGFEEWSSTISLVPGGTLEIHPRLVPDARLRRKAGLGPD